jgi:hypothetical protein
MRPVRPRHLRLAIAGLAAGLLALTWAADGKQADGRHHSATAPAEAVEATARSGPGELAMPYFSFARRSGGGR